MVAPVLVTKLYAPPPRDEAIPRSRLIAHLDAGLRRRLTLVSAPAGFGKTTLVAAWVTGCGRPSAWLSLDAGDSDPPRFLAHLVAALRTVAPGIGAGVVAALESPLPPIEAILSPLLNELAALPEEVVLVLDDYHAIDARPVDEAVAFLVEHLPPRLHLVIATREDPPLLLPRLRARGQLTELRAADLRFTHDEAAAFLTGAMGLDLAAADVAILEARTEGWIAGLQLAALSLQGHADMPGFVREFAGEDRYIVDYLADEVLRRQPDAIRDFLLQTAILARLSGPLCDAVTGQEGGSARLEALERGNFFLVPLDDKRRWYRYHHLFADVLQAHLLAEQADRLPDLHRRASAWHERHGDRAEVIRHALAAGDAARAADLIELSMPAMLSSRREATLLGWLAALPDEVIRHRPVLGAGYATALLVAGELAGVEARLRDAERWLELGSDGPGWPETPSELVVADEAEFRRLPGVLAVARAGQALALGDVDDTMRHARRALDLVPEDDQFRRGSAAALLGLAAWASGDLAAAHRAYAEGLASLRRAGSIPGVLGCAVALADLRIAQGRLREARRTYEDALQLATEQGMPTFRGTADMHVGLAELHRERDDLPAAVRLLQRSKELGEHAGLPQHPYRWCVATARLKEAQGDPGGALALLDEAERRYVRDFFPEVRPIAALKVRVWVAQGRLDDALAWARERGLSAGDAPAFLREFEHLTLARVFLARYARDQDARTLQGALGLLGRLLTAAVAGERAGSVIDCLLLQARAHWVQGDLPAALAPLERALLLAEPEGYIRTFVDEGEAMRDLLRHAAARGVAGTYARRLLAAFGAPGAPASSPARPRVAALAEPLTERELAVLRLVAAGLRNQEIADQLFISLATVKRHIANAYGKLGAGHRTEAIVRATELHLL